MNETLIEDDPRNPLGLGVSAFPAHVLIDNFLPGGATAWVGKRVLDIAPGLSSLVPTLRHLGVDAYGADLGYRDFSKMAPALERMAAISTRNGAELGIRTAQETHELLKDPSTHSSLIGANAAHLPFVDEAFDLVVSSSFITQRNPDQNPELADFIEKVLREALRVTRPAASIKIGPRSVGAHKDYKDGGFKSLFDELMDESLGLEKVKQISIQGVQQSIFWELVKSKKSAKGRKR